MLNLITTKPGDKYRSLRNPRAYEALRRQGYSKGQAARISNAQASRRRHKTYTLDQLEQYVCSPCYDPAIAQAIAERVPEIPSLKGEQIAPGITRIRGNLCNVHGKYGKCPGASAAPAKKPAKGRAARKPVKTPEQRAQARAAERQANVDKVKQQMADSDTGLSPAGVDALAAFAEGTPPTGSIAEGLARMGLAERAEDGSYRMTPTGRAAVSAMQAGDYQRAVDTISRGQDTASARQGRQTAQQARQQATAQRRAESEAKRQQAAAERARRQAEQAKRGSGGGKKPAAQATPAKRQPFKAPTRSGAAPSVGGLQAKPKPKPAAAPKPEKPAAPARQETTPALAETARNLSDGNELSDDDTQALIRNGLARLNKDGELILTAAGQRAVRQKAAPEHTGVMVGLYPDPAAAKAIAAQDGVTEPIDQLHLTLAFMGDSTETALATNKDKLIAAIKQWAVEQGKPLEGAINGLGRFFHSEDDDTNAVYVAPDVPGLPELRQSLVDWIERSGFDYAQNHGFTPHITVAYVPLDAPTPPIRIESPVVFKQVTLAWGDERYDYPLGAVAQKDASFKVFKDARGQWRWVAQSSTAYQDRDREIVSTKALADDVLRADADGLYGPLRWWHTPGLDLGDTDFNAMHGRVLIESGTFRSEAIAHKVARAAAGLEISLGFLHAPSEPDAHGVFHHIRRFERSLVPRGKASNRFTAFTVKEPQPMDATKVAALKALGFSDSDIVDIESRASATEKAAADQGVAFKAEEPAEELPDLVINGVTYKAFPPKAAAAEPVEEEEEEAEIETDAVDEMPMDEGDDDPTALTLSQGDLAAIAEAIGGALQQAVATIMGGLDLEKKVAGHVQGMLAPLQATKDAEQAETRQQVAQLAAQVAELSGDAPAVPYRPTQARDNVLTEAALLAVTKQAQGGPFDDIIKGLGLGQP